MRVTRLQKITDRRYKVFLEDGMSFPLYSGEVRKYHIAEGEEIADGILREILDEVLTRRAKLRCLNLLKSMDRTEGQLRSRLSQDGYPDWITDRAIEYASSYHYIDDSRYAQNYVRQMSGRRSRRQIESDLMNKGLDREQVRSAFEELAKESMPGGESEDPDITAIKALALKRGFEPGRGDSNPGLLTGIPARSSSGSCFGRGSDILPSGRLSGTCQYNSTENNTGHVTGLYPRI